MYGLEYTAFIFDLAIGFLCGQLTLLHYFNAGKSFEKTTGLIGLIGGGIGFLITLIYVCFSGYIFNNDVAYRTLEDDNDADALYRLYSNGAYTNVDGSTIFANEIDDDAQYVKYKDLGSEQYNYNKKFYEAYSESTRRNCIYGGSCSSSSCDYCYPDLISSTTNPSSHISSLSFVSIDNKYLYDRWCLSLVLAVFITVLNAGIVVFGLLFFLNKGGDSGDAKPVEIK